MIRVRRSKLPISNPNGQTPRVLLHPQDLSPLTTPSLYNLTVRFTCSIHSMANVNIISLRTGDKLRVAKDDLIHQVQHIEKKTFPRREAMDFCTELQKRNMDLIIIVDDTGVNATVRPKLVSYLVFVHLKAGNAVLLHKVCVAQEYRRRGIAKAVLETQAETLKKQGCTKIQLWVDAGNVPARRLYEALGLEEVSKVNDYYAIGRTGIQMIWRLSSR